MAEFATSIDIEAPPEVVFEHLTTEAGLLAWMGEHAELQPAPGGTFAVDIRGTPIRGRYLEIDAPRRLVVSWGIAGSGDLPPGASRVEFTLTSHDWGTRLELCHTGLPDTAGWARGWTHYLGRLRVRAKGDDPGPDPGMDGD